VRNESHNVWAGVIAFVVVGAIAGALNPSKPANQASPPPVSVPAATHAAPPTAARRAFARRILLASVDHYQHLFAQGQAIIGVHQYSGAFEGLAALSDPTSAASRFRDYRQHPNPESDQSFQQAFARADHIFTADNEPQAISDWQADMSDLTSGLSVWINEAVEWKIQEIPTAKLDAAASSVRTGLAQARRDALLATS